MHSRLRRLATCCVWLTLPGAIGSAAAAPRYVCYTVMPGDTVTAIAARLTSDARNWRDPGFQIFDPLRARFIPKTDYSRIQSGWHACLGDALLMPSAVPRSRDPVTASAAGLPIAVSSQTRALTRWSWLTLLCSVAAMAGLLVSMRTQRANVSDRVLEAFGNAFIREFERPLMEERGARTAVLRTELTVSARHGSLDVRLAPVEGRTYPNLADHRMNVEYDVQRVIALLNDPRFVPGPLARRGEWVSIPFRFVSNSSTARQIPITKGGT
jgi:hypothetical protein